MRLLLGIKIKECLLLGFLAIFICCKKQIKEKNIGIEDNSRVTHLPYYKDKSFTPHWIVPDSEEEKNFHRIPDFQLINQLGDTISQKTFDGKIYIVDFFFTTCPGICLKMTNHMLKLQEKFKTDTEILFLSHSVTPTIDSVSVLKHYAVKNNVIDYKWHLVTGDRKEIYDLGRNHYFVENDLGVPRDIDDFLHSENFLLIDKRRHIRGIYNGLNRASIAQLITDINTLRSER